MIYKVSQKKSQIKMFENIGIMIIFFFLLSFGLIFYNRYQTMSVSETIEKNNVDNLIKTSKKIYYLPELKCSQTEIDSCIDYTKVQAFKELVQNQLSEDYYYNIFRHSTVSIEQTFPEKESIEIYSRPKIKDLTQVQKLIIPISIYKPIKETYGFGLLNVTIYI